MKKRTLAAMNPKVRGICTSPGSCLVRQTLADIRMCDYDSLFEWDPELNIRHFPWRNSSESRMLVITEIIFVALE